MKKIITYAALVAIGTMGMTNAATLVTGTQIGFELGSGGTDEANWNNVNAPGAGNVFTITAGSVVDLSGVAVDGVTFSYDTSQYGSRGFNTDVSNSAAIAALSGSPFTTASIDQLAWSSGGALGDRVVMTIGGLDNTLNYNVAVATNAGASNTSVMSVDVNGGTASAFAGNTINFHSFANQSVNGSNQLVLELFNDNDPNFDNPFVNGIHIEAIAVPEPSNTALLGLGGLALILRRRK